jgi:hypothetical protein
MYKKGFPDSSSLDNSSSDNFSPDFFSKAEIFDWTILRPNNFSIGQFFDRTNLRSDSSSPKKISSTRSSLDNTSLTFFPRKADDNSSDNSVGEVKSEKYILGGELSDK